MKTQLVFNNQRYINEAAILARVASQFSTLTKGRLSLTFYPAKYTSFTSIPSVVEMFPMTTITADNVEPKWYEENIYSLNPDADQLIFITNRADWWDRRPEDGGTVGYTRGHNPSTFPHFISIMAEEGHMSWQKPNMPAFDHYVLHELAHGFCDVTGLSHQLVHDLDYSNRMQELYDMFDYNKINVALGDKRKLSGRMSYFYKRPNDGTIYVLVEGVMVGFSTDYQLFKKDWPSAQIMDISNEQFNLYKQANWHTVAKRN